MADSHYEVNPTIARGGELHGAIVSLQRAWDEISDLRQEMIQMKDGAASGVAVYAKQAAQFGYGGADLTAQETEAAGSFAEIDACWNAANAAIVQFIARHL